MKTYTKNRISSIVYYLATILFAGGILLFVPFLIGVIGGESRSMGELLSGYVIPGISSMLVGAVLRRISNVQPLSLRDAMFVCTLAWVLMTLVGAVPFNTLRQRSGLEWLFRLYQEPRRLTGRYLRTNSIFVARVLAAVLNVPRRRAWSHSRQRSAGIDRQVS